MDIYADFHNIKKIILSLTILFCLLIMWHYGIVAIFYVLLFSIVLSGVIAVIYSLWMDSNSYHEASGVWVFPFIAYLFLRLDFSGNITNMIKLIEIPFLSDSIIWILVGTFIINFVIHLEPHNAIQNDSADQYESYGYWLSISTIIGMGITIILSGLTKGYIFILPDTYMIPIFYGSIILSSQFRFPVTGRRSINGIVIILLLYSTMAIYENIIKGTFPPIIPILIELILLISFFWMAMKPEEREGKYTGSVISYPHYRIKFFLVVVWFLILYFTIPKEYQLVESVLIFPLIFFSEFIVDLFKGIRASSLSGKGGIIGGAGPFDSLYSTFSFTIFVYLVFEIIVMKKFSGI